MMQKTWKWLKPWHMGTLSWESSVRAIHWIPTWQGLDGFQRSLRPCPLDRSSLSIRRVNPYATSGYNLVNTKWCKKPENDWNPGIWVLIWESSVRAIHWIPTWQGLDGFQRSLRPCALDRSSLSIGRVNPSMPGDLLDKCHLEMLLKISLERSINLQTISSRVVDKVLTKTSPSNISKSLLTWWS